ncbi:RNA polymerase sigma factor [Streptomyces sp. NPDC090499]|uniref:RNA polymerase sigma factor n=1 Tax=Streptomyces sp. NPDC090499 TaxID=3365965 RepID=UPI0037F5F0C6
MARAAGPQVAEPDPVTGDPRLALYRAQHPRLAGYVGRRVRDETVAADICQQVWAAYFRRSWQGYADEIAPLFVIARRRIADWYEEAGRAADLPGDAFLYERLDQGRDDDLPESDRANARVDLQMALARLTERQRQAVTLRYIDGLDRGSAAALMGIGVDGLKKLTSAAVRELRSMPELQGYLLALDPLPPSSPGPGAPASLDQGASR